jgi:hypothetical protein
MYPRLKRLYPWKPLVKKGVPTSIQTVRSPQPNGTPGWILLSHNDTQAHALFVDGNGNRVEDVPLIVDERLCSDTILRAVRLSKGIIVVSDIWVLGGRNLHGKLPFAKRLELLAEILELFHTPDLTALVHPNDLPAGTLLRGYEYYDDLPGSLGTFLPAVE